MAVEGGGNSRGIGARLRAGREKLGLTVLQAGERLHVEPKTLEWLEAENFSALGAPVYVRGHLRHYAELVGESGQELQDLYSHSVTVAPPDLTRIAHVPPSKESNRLIAAALFLVGGFAVAGAVWWVLSLSEQKPESLDTTEVEQTASQNSPAGTAQIAGVSGPSAAAGQSNFRARIAESGSPVSAVSERSASSVARNDTTPATANTRGTTGANSVAASREAAVPSADTSTVKAPSAQTSSGSSHASTAVHLASAGASTSSTAAALGTGPGAAAASAESGATAESGTAAGPEAADRAPREARLTLRFSADSWTEVYDASGERLFYDVGAADSVRTLKGTPPLRVVLGNAPGVAVEVNGHHTPITKWARPDGSAQFVISRTGHATGSKP